MTWIRVFIHRLRGLFLKRKLEQELEDEVRAHLEMQIEDNLKQGMSPDEARYAALQKFGGVEQVKESYRERRGLPIVESTLWDLRYALRMLRRSPGFAIVVALTLGLGIGANTAIFSLLDAALLKTLPVKNPEQLVFLERPGSERGGRRTSNLTYAYFEELQTQRETLDGVCAFAGSPRVNVVIDGQAEVVQAQPVSGGFFTVLGVNAMLGRIFTEHDDKFPGAHPVVVISYNYWQRRFARDPAIVGKTIVINNHPFTIIGVTPPDFFGVTVGEAPDLWAPAMMYAQIFPGQSIEQYFKRPLAFVLARLKPGVTEQQASTALTELWLQFLMAETASQLSPEKRQSLRNDRIVLAPANQGLSILRAQFSEPLRILMAVVGLILLIACANVANLLLARAATRRKEIAVRLALGAGRLRLIRQLLTESMLLAVAGGALGLLFARWCSGFLLALVVSGRNPVFLKLTLDARALGFTAAVSLLTSVLFGLAPALRATQVDLSPTLKDGSRDSDVGGRLGLGKMLVIAQVALSLLLLIGAGLFVRSLEKLKSLDAGINQENVLLASTAPRLIGYQGKQIADLYQRLLERIKAIPGVRSASFSGVGLLSGNGTNSAGSVHVHGRPVRLEENTRTEITTPLCDVGPEYFETVGMTILRGRGFTAQDNVNAHRVAVVSETFARDYFNGEDPLGQRFSVAPNSNDEIEIVGVVKDAKYISLREKPLRTYYVPYLQNSSSWRDTTFQIRAVEDPTQIIAAVRQAAREVDARLPIFNVKTLAKQVDESLMQERLIGTVSGFFGILSLLLAAVGLFGIVAYAVNRRTREIGIRMALGAHRGAVLRMVLRQGMTLVLIGDGLGLLLSLMATRIIASQLFGVTAHDPVTFVAAPILLLIVALLACIVPARRATKVDPMITLRNE